MENIYLAEDWESETAVLTSQHQSELTPAEMLPSLGYNEIQQLLNDYCYPENAALENADQICLATLNSSRTNTAVQQRLHDENQQCLDATRGASFTLLSPDLETNWDLDLQNGDSHWNTDLTHGNIDQFQQQLESWGPGLTKEVTKTPPRSSNSPPAATRGRRRRQNHACDSCRSSKKACDLPRNVSIDEAKPSTPCSGCKLRGMECTVDWLVSRQTGPRARKRSGTESHISSTQGAHDTNFSENTLRTITETLPSQVLSISTIETDLGRRLASQITCTQQFDLYVNNFDIPISDCLSEGSLPPCFSLGVAACGPLRANGELSGFLNKADSWIKSCWNARLESPQASTATAPQVFRTVSILDSFFGHSGAGTYSAAMAARDTAITETYKWAAIATAAQVVFDKPDLSENGSHYDSQAYGQRIASATWRKAKDMVFGNIAAVNSFRLSLSLVLFGVIPPPANGEQRVLLSEDSEYALCEGIRRLRTLCSRVRACLNESTTSPGSSSNLNCSRDRFPFIRKLTSDVRENIYELIGALEWFTMLCNSVTISTSHGTLSPFRPETCDDELGSPERSAPSDQTHSPETTPTPADRSSKQDFDSSILARAEGQGQAFTCLWQPCIPSDEVVLRVGRRSGALATLLWKAVGDLTLAARTVQTGKPDYKAILKNYATTVALIKLWRSTFGTFNDSMIRCLQQTRREARRIFMFCSNDTDLAILLFCDIVHTSETSLAEKESTRERTQLLDLLQASKKFRKEQKLLSALQVSVITSTCQSLDKPDGSGEGTIRTHLRDMCAHPKPAMVVQVHMLAAQALADEVSHSNWQPDLKHASDVRSGLETCLWGLRGLKEHLTSFPDIPRLKNEMLVY